MKVKMAKRNDEIKSETNRIRREGDIPAVLYSKEKPAESITITGADFHAALRNTPKGRLPTTVFSLTDESGKERRAIVKDIQYHVTTYNILHLDFEELDEKTEVNIKVPIEFTGVAECAGVKQGGVLRQVIRHIRVRCLPKDIPTRFTLDVERLNMKQSKRLRDLDIPSTVRPLVDVNEVAVTIAKR